MSTYDDMIHQRTMAVSMLIVPVMSCQVGRVLTPDTGTVFLKLGVPASAARWLSINVLPQ